MKFKDLHLSLEEYISHFLIGATFIDKDSGETYIVESYNPKNFDLNVHHTRPPELYRTREIRDCLEDTLVEPPVALKNKPLLKVLEEQAIILTSFPEEKYLLTPPESEQGDYGYTS